MALYIEDRDAPGVKLARAFNTNLPATFSSTLAVTGATTVTGLLTANGGLTVSGVLQGNKENIISSQGAGPTTLTAAQSGSTVLFDRAAGNAFVLPAPAVGLNYCFLTTVSCTSNAHEVVTDAGTTFLLGSVTVALNSATPGGDATFSGDGSTHVEYTNNGTTQGGLLGSQVWFTCVTSTLWLVTGTTMGSGTLATPFTT